MNNDRLLPDAGPWVTDAVRADNTPMKIHPSPDSDVDARVAIATARMMPNISPDANGEYSVGALLATLAVNVATMNDMLTRNREEPFSFDVMDVNQWVRRVPRGVVKCIVNPLSVPIPVAVSESTGPGALKINQTFAANSITYCFIPFVRGLFSQPVAGFIPGLQLHGVYTES